MNSQLVKIDSFFVNLNYVTCAHIDNYSGSITLWLAFPQEDSAKPLIFTNQAAKFLIGLLDSMAVHKFTTPPRETDVRPT
jgi:hypothetical protein